MVSGREGERLREGMYLRDNPNLMEECVCQKSVSLSHLGPIVKTVL